MSNTEAIPPSWLAQAEIIIEEPAWNMCDFDLQKHTDAAVAAALQQVNFPFHHNIEVAVLLTNDGKLRELNCTFRNIDKPTNVLSFPSNHDAIANIHADDEAQNLRGEEYIQQIFLGDVAISYERIMAESLEQNKSFQAHYTHMIVHSVLHLLGYDHEDDAEANAMENLEIKILSRLNIANPYIIN